MSNLIEDLSRTLLADDHRSQGRLVDLNTGTVRRDRVLIQRTPGADLFIGFGPRAGRLLDFAFTGETNGDPVLTRCAVADDVIAEGDLRKTQQLDLDAAIAEIGEPHLRRLALVEATLEKAGVDDPVRPGWPAGTPGSRGGQFRPKDDSAEAKERTEADLKRLEARAKFRIMAITLLKFIATLPQNWIPGGEEATDVENLINFGQAAIETGNLEREVTATVEFVKGGPYTLNDLRMSDEDQGFSSMYGFEKISPAVATLLKVFGSAPSGEEYHHIVEQGGKNEQNIPAEQLHSTQNVIPLPRMLHEMVSAEYSKLYDEKSRVTVRQWLQTQPYDVQWKYGVDTLKKLGIVK
jgi:hypothetical protein